MYTYKTLAGLTFLEVAAQLDKELPPSAYKEVPGGAGLTDISPDWMRKVLNELFGLCGIGWGYTFDAADVVVRPGTKQTSKGERATHFAHLTKLIFWYVLLDEQGQRVKAEIPSTGGSENPNEGFALSGAVTNALGKAVSNIGFQESVYLGRRSHQTVGKRPMPQPAPKPAPPAKPAGGNGNGGNGHKPEPAKAAEPKPAQTAPTDDLNDPGNFLVPFGTLKDKRLGELSAKSLRWFASEMKATTPVAQAVQTAAAAYLAAHPELAAAPVN